MKPHQIVSLVLFCIALALFNALPYVSGVVTGIALLVALPEDDDDDYPPHGPRSHQPT